MQNKIAVFPAKFGFNLGWYIEQDNYCIVFGNCQSREIANEMLKREKPGVEIVNLEKEPYHRRNPLPNYPNP